MTVGSGITPESARPTPSAKNVALAGSDIRTGPDAITAGGDFHPALRTCTKHTVASPSKHAQRLPLSRPGARYRDRSRAARKVKWVQFVRSELAGQGAVPHARVRSCARAAREAGGGCLGCDGGGPFAVAGQHREGLGRDPVLSGGIAGRVQAPRRFPEIFENMNCVAEGRGPRPRRTRRRSSRRGRAVPIRTATSTSRRALAGFTGSATAAGRADHVVRAAFRGLGVVDGDERGHPLAARLLPGRQPGPHLPQAGGGPRGGAPVRITMPLQSADRISSVAGLHGSGIRAQ
jgi:hypothetical protein